MDAPLLHDNVLELDRRDPFATALDGILQPVGDADVAVRVDSGSINVLIGAMETAVSPGCAVFTHEFRGTASRVPADATAFGLRRDHVLVEILATFDDGSDRLAEQRHRQWARETRESFNPSALPGGYPNLLAADDPQRVAKSYGGNAERLINAKRRYDPDNVFRSAIPLPVAAATAGA